MCVLTSGPHGCRRLFEFVGLVLTLTALSANAVYGQTMTPEVFDTNLVKWGLTQGGLTILVLVLGWSYRRDLRQMAATKDQTIDVLVELVKQSTATNQKLTSVVEALAVEVRRLEPR